MLSAARCGVMAGYRIHVIDHDFTATEEIQASDLAAARVHALKGALSIGTDEVCSGKPFFGAEISIECEGAKPERMLIAIGTSPLAEGK